MAEEEPIFLDDEYNGRYYLLIEERADGILYQTQCGCMCCCQREVRGILLTDTHHNQLWWSEEGRDELNRLFYSFCDEDPKALTNDQKDRLAAKFGFEIRWDENPVEAFLPILWRGKKHVLTWWNCD